jgi:hypothetical protein
MIFIGCASYNPLIKNNEMKSFVSDFNQIVQQLYSEIIISQNEQDITTAYYHYLFSLDMLYRKVSLFIDNNKSLVSSKCWRDEITNYYIEISKNLSERKKKADFILSRYNPEFFKQLDKKCEDKIKIYSFNLSRKLQDIIISNYSDLKDQCTVVYQRDDGFSDIIYENNCIRYVGYMKNGKFHGRGKLFSITGVSEGSWINGIENGLFIYNDNDGTIVKGTMVNGKFEGNVISIWTDGEVIKHKYKNGICLDDE